MDILNTIKDMASEAATTVVAKTNEAVEITKLRIAMGDVEANIGRDLKDIGELVYKAHKFGGNVTTDVATKCEAVDELYEQLDDLRQQLNQIRKVKLCESCKSEVNVTDNFCPKCGGNL